MALSSQKKGPETFGILVLKETNTFFFVVKISEGWKESAKREMNLSDVKLAGK